MRATRAARLFFLIQPIRSLFSGVVAAVAVVLASALFYLRIVPLSYVLEQGAFSRIANLTKCLGLAEGVNHGHRENEKNRSK